MPQLDQSTFFSQFFWLSFFYLGFYLILVKYFLPKMSRILKVRNMKMNSGGTSGSGQTDFLTMKEENEKIKKMRDEALSEAFKESKNFLNESYQKTSSWVQRILQDVNKKKLQKMNKTYIESVQNLSFAQTLTLHNLKTVISPSSYKTSGISSLNNSEKLKVSKDNFYNILLLKSLTRKKTGILKPVKK